MNLSTFSLVLLCCAPALAQRPSAADAAAIFEKGRENALAYAKSLPDFVCTEVIQRYRASPATIVIPLRGTVSRTDPPAWAPLDKLTVKLSFFQQKEDHKLEQVNGRPTTMQYDSLNGATGRGEFGGMLEQIFDPASQASFRWESWKRSRAHRVAVYGYTVAEAHSQYVVEHDVRPGEVKRAIVGFHGTVEIDSETGEVLHLDYTADHIPAAVGLTHSTTAVDFEPVDVGGTAFLLPVRSEEELDGLKASLKNDIEFRGFGKFDASSTVDFGAGK